MRPVVCKTWFYLLLQKINCSTGEVSCPPLSYIMNNDTMHFRFLPCLSPCRERTKKSEKLNENLQQELWCYDCILPPVSYPILATKLICSVRMSFIFLNHSLLNHDFTLVSLPTFLNGLSWLGPFFLG